MAKSSDSKNTDAQSGKMLRAVRAPFIYITENRGKPAVVLLQVFCVVIFVSISAFLFAYFEGSWIFFGILQGIFFGFIVGFIIIAHVSPNKQIAAIGAVSGMTLDLAVSYSAETPGTAINVLAKFISNLIAQIAKAAEDTGVPPPQEAALSWGLWVFILIVGAIMVWARVTAPNAEEG